MLVKVVGKWSKSGREPLVQDCQLLPRRAEGDRNPKNLRKSILSPSGNILDEFRKSFVAFGNQKLNTWKSGREVVEKWSEVVEKWSENVGKWSKILNKHR